MKENSVGQIHALQKKVDEICKKFPSLERSDVYHTLVLLKKPPLERLKMALARAQKTFSYR